MNKPIILPPDVKPDPVSQYRQIDRLYTTKEAAEVLQVGDRIVRKLVSSGHLRAIKLGGIKIRGSELERFMEQSEGLDYTDVTSPQPLLRR